VHAVLRGSMCGLPGILTGFTCALDRLRSEFRVHAVHQGLDVRVAWHSDRIFVCACPATTGVSCTRGASGAQIAGNLAFRPVFRVRLPGYDRSFVYTRCTGAQCAGCLTFRPDFRVRLPRYDRSFVYAQCFGGPLCGLPGIQTGYLCALAPLRPEFRVHAVHQGRKSPGFLADRIFVCTCPAGTGVSCTTSNQRAQFDRFQPGSDRNFVCVGSCHRSFVYDRCIRR
jgi:hypothetical protein